MKYFLKEFQTQYTSRISTQNVKSILTRNLLLFFLNLNQNPSKHSTADNVLIIHSTHK